MDNPTYLPRLGNTDLPGVWVFDVKAQAANMKELE